MTRVCAHCSRGQVALLSCVCGEAAYCGRECQRRDWPRHKPSCPPYVLKDCGLKGKGRGLFATRNLPAYSVVSEEEPVLVAGSEDMKGDGLMAAFRQLPEATQEKVLNLYDPDPEVAAVSDEEFILRKLQRIVTTDATEKALGAGLKDSRYGPEESRVRYLYLASGSINHSCNPNCHWRGEKDVGIITTLVPVKKGEELTVNYFFNPYDVAGQFCLSYRERKIKVGQEFGFDCLCQECVLRGKDDHLRSQYKKWDLEIDGGFHDLDSTVKLFQTAESKLELGRNLDNQVLFRDLMDCLVLLQILMDSGLRTSAYREKIQMMDAELQKVRKLYPYTILKTMRKWYLYVPITSLSARKL